MGTSASQPTKKRNVSGIMLDLGDEMVLVDCGDGTQSQILKYGRKIFVDRIFITHMHGDHYFGLFGLLSTMELNNRSMPLWIYGPPNMMQLAMTMEKHCKINFKIFYNFVTPNQKIKFKKYMVIPHLGRHTITNYMYEFKLYDYRQLDVAKLNNQGVRPGKHYKLLKKGQDVFYENRILKAQNYLKPEIKGKKIVISGDTRPVDNPKIYKNCGILIHECTYLKDSEIGRAKKRLHTVYSEIIKMQKKYKIPIICTHFSAKCLNMPKNKKDLIFAHDGLIITYV